MPPKKSFLDSDSDDDLLPDNSKNAPKPAAKPAAVPVANTTSPLSGGGGSMGSKPSSWSPEEGMPPPPVAANDATLEMLRARREMRSQMGRPNTAPAPAAAASRESPLRTTTAPSAGAGMPPAARSNSPKIDPTPAPRAQSPHPALPVAAATTMPSDVKPATQPPNTAADEAAREEAARLAATAAAELEAKEIALLTEQIAQREAALILAREREAALRKQEEADSRRHEESIRNYQEEIRRLEREMAHNDDEYAQERARIRAESDEIVAQQLRAVNEGVDAEYAPRIKELELRLDELTAEKAQLQHSMSLSSSNKSIVDQAILAATQRIAAKLETEFTKRFERDESWELHLAEMVRGALNDSFLPQLKADESAERAEQKRAFEEMLGFWRQAEDEEREVAMKNDDILLAELQSMAHADLDILHRQELELQQAFVRARDDWAARHKQTLDREIELAVERRDAEFGEIRKAQQHLYAQRLAEINRAHELEVQRLQEIHETELKVLREGQALRQVLEDERRSMVVAVRRDAEEATASIRETIAGLADAVARLDAYKTALDRRGEQLEKEYEADLAAREAAVGQVQEMVVQQATTLDMQRRAIANAQAKLDAVNTQVSKQNEETKVWIAQNVAKLERSKQEWEREYRRWQHVAAQEKRNAEQRYSGLLLELRRSCDGLREDRERLDADIDSHRRRGEERSARLAQQAALIRQREAEIRGKHLEMVQLVAELESKAKGMSDEWHRLHLERQDLHYRRAELQAEEAKIRATEDQIRQTRNAMVAVQGDAISAQERARAVQEQTALIQHFASESERSRQQQENAARDSRAKATTQQVQLRQQQVMRRDHATQPSALAPTASAVAPGQRLAPSLAERMLNELRAESRHAGIENRYADPRSSQQLVTGSDAAPPAVAGPSRVQMAAAAAVGGGGFGSTVDVSRTTRGPHDATVATSHWTALERLSELETTSGSTRT